MTKLYADLRHHHHHHHQVTFKVDQQGAFKTESMSSLGEVSDVSPPPKHDVDAQLISRVYGAGRKPTTIALSFRPPRKQRFADKLPKLITKTTKSSRRRPGKVTSQADDAASLDGCGDSSHGNTTSVRQNNGMVTSKSMHSLHRTNTEDSHRQTQPALGGSRIRKITTLLERRQTVTSSPEVKECRPNDPTHSNNTNGARSSSCPVPQLTVTTAAAVADNSDSKHVVQPARRELHPSVSDLQRRSSTPATSTLLRPPAAVDRLSPGRGSVGAGLPSKPPLDSLFNTHGDLAKFRQLLRESTDETASEQRVNYCCDVTTTRIEAWLRAVRAARFSSGGLCKQIADESLESEQAIRKLRNNDTESDVKHS